MTPERSTPWYAEWYIWACAVAVLLGGGIVGGDLRDRRAKADAIVARAQAEERRVREEAQALDDQERARLALEEIARRRGTEESDQAEREMAEATAKTEASADYRYLLGQAREHEAGLPGVASRYYYDIARKFPGSAQAKAATVKSRDLWALAYGGQDGPAPVEAEGSGRRPAASVTTPPASYSAPALSYSAPSTSYSYSGGRSSSGSHRSYGNQGGHYAGGSGSSHKGGHYVNPRTNNHYTRHR